MAIPSYMQAAYPLLTVIKDQRVYKMRHVVEPIADIFNLTPDERTERLDGSQTNVLKSRIGWAKTHLSKAGLIDIVARGEFRISNEGIRIVNDPSITYIDETFLKQYPEYRAYLSTSNKVKTVTVTAPVNTIQQPVVNSSPSNIGVAAPSKLQPASVVLTPQIMQPQTKSPIEIMVEQSRNLKQEVKAELLQMIVNQTPDFFEQLIVDLVLAMGYGGLVEDAGQVIGKTSDGGVDGVIKQDVLGIDLIYLQAKRYTDTKISRPVVQGFVGSLEGKKAQKGIFITTSSFTREAREYIENEISNFKVVGIDGDQLTDLMFKYQIGVQTEHTFTTKRVDLDYFTDDK